MRRKKILILRNFLYHTRIFYQYTQFRPEQVFICLMHKACINSYCSDGYLKISDIRSNNFFFNFAPYQRDIFPHHNFSSFNTILHGCQYIKSVQSQLYLSPSSLSIKALNLPLVKPLASLGPSSQSTSSLLATLHDFSRGSS